MNMNSYIDIIIHNFVVNGHYDENKSDHKNFIKFIDFAFKYAKKFSNNDEDYRISCEFIRWYAQRDDEGEFFYQGAFSRIVDLFLYNKRHNKATTNSYS